MLNLERQAKILELIEEHGKVEVGDLSRLLRASEVTIRKDLKELQARGLLRRAHGGAVRAVTVSADPSLQVKAALHADEKRRIGAAAAALVADGESIILDSGTTTQQVARYIKDRRDLKVITNALNVAAELTGAGGVEVILLGGLLRQHSGSLVGQFAEEMLKQLSVDKLFLAVDAVDLEFGLSTPTSTSRTSTRRWCAPRARRYSSPIRASSAAAASRGSCRCPRSRASSQTTVCPTRCARGCASWGSN